MGGQAGAAGAASGQAPTDAQPQAGTTPTPQAGGATNGQDPAAQKGGSTDPRDEMLAAARREAAEWRTKVRDFEKAQADQAQKDLTEVEKRDKRIRDLETELEQVRASDKARALREAAFSAATKLGYRDPDLAHRLVPASEIEYTDDGQPKNIEALLKKLADERPHLVKEVDFGGGNRGPSPTGGEPSMNELLRAAIRG